MIVRSFVDDETEEDQLMLIYIAKEKGLRGGVNEME
jgi:hypothetical protein